MGRGAQNSNSICGKTNSNNLRYRSSTCLTSTRKRKINNDNDNGNDNDNYNDIDIDHYEFEQLKRNVHFKSETFGFTGYYHPNNKESKLPDHYYQLPYDFLCEKAKEYGIFLYHDVNGEKISTNQIISKKVVQKSESSSKRNQKQNSQSDKRIKTKEPRTSSVSTTLTTSLSDDGGDNDSDDTIYRLAEKRCHHATREQLLIGLLPYARILLESVKTINNNKNKNIQRMVPNCLPLDPPHFTLTDIKKSIPKHLFERSLMKSMLHLMFDFLSLSMILYFGIYHLQSFVEYTNHLFVMFISQIIGHIIMKDNNNINNTHIEMSGDSRESNNAEIYQEYSLFIIKCIAWCSYWILQGTVMTGIWVMAHECGHQAFSKYTWINNTVGLFLHSFLLVPYHSWRISHGKHHSNTGSCENDEVFNPYTKSDFDTKKELLLETPVMTALNLLLMLTIGWMPGYLILNATGPKKYRTSSVMKRNHFMPNSILFNYNKDFYDIIISDLGFFIALYLIFYKGIEIYGVSNIIYFYFIPYMITNFWLVLITFLQHTDVFIPHFRGKEWNWLRGALCTCDRSFGFILNHMLHHITDTHVCHHLFSKMPFYNAQEATQHMKQILGPYYLNDKNSSIIRATWRSFRYCNYIDNQYVNDNANDEGGNDIVFFKSEIHFKS